MSSILSIIISIIIYRPRRFHVKDISKEGYVLKAYEMRLCFHDNGVYCETEVCFTIQTKNYPLSIIGNQVIICYCI